MKLKEKMTQIFAWKIKLKIKITLAKKKIKNQIENNNIK